MELIDLSNIRKITNNNSEVIGQFLQVFADNTTKDLHLLKNAIKDNDPHQVHYFVHKLKSSTQSIGYMNGHKQLQRIEDKLRLSHPIKPLRAELMNVTKECELAVIEARQLLEKFIK